MTKFNVSRIVIDEGNSDDIMYDELFIKFDIKSEKLSPYMDIDL